MVLRRVAEQDLPSCLRVIRESFATVAEEFQLTPENCPTNGAFLPMERLKEDFQKGNPMVCAYEGNEPVGFYALEPLAEAGTFALEKLAVLPAFRHRGIGRELLLSAKKEAASLGADKLTAGIIEENTRLKEWYQLNGFIHKGTRQFAHLPFTVGYMELNL